MAYRLEAVIGPAAVLSAAIRQLPLMVLAPLWQGLGLVPMTDEVFDAVNDGTPPGLPGFWKLPGGFERMHHRRKAHAIGIGFHHRGRSSGRGAAQHFAVIGSERAQADG